MTTDTRFPPDAEFEAELRAMLQRRAADVHPSRANVRVARAEPSTGSTSSAAMVVRLDRPEQRRIARISAALMLIAGAVGLATVAATGRPADTGSNTTTGGPPVVIWPLGDAVSPDQQATPESATHAYLSEVAGLGPDFPLDRSVIDGAEATVDYTLEGTPSSVSLRQRDGGWYVIGATNELAVIEWVAAPDGNQVDIEVKPGRRAAPVDRLRARLVDRSGEVYDTADVEYEDGKRVDPGGPPLADGSWQTYLFVGDKTEPVAVRVDVLSANADTDAVVAHASVPVPGAPDALDPATVAPPATTAPPITVDPDPQPMPPGPDRLPALWADEGSSAADSGSSGLEGWPDAATALLNTVVDDESPKGPPSFADVSLDPDELTVRGRYSMPDGDAGTFELVRLDDGRWGMTSLRSDDLDVIEVGRTGARVQITLVSAKDADLGVGGHRVGLEPGEPWVSAGRDAVFSVECGDDSSAAILYQFLDAHDGTNLRFAEAWPC
jgi:hypothetical protein